MFDFRYKNASNMHDSRIKRTDSVAMLRHRRRIAANDERRVCIDRCAEVAATAAPSSPLLYYLMRLRSCCDAQREILAFLIYQKLPTSLSKAAIDEMHARGLIPIIVQCLIVNDLLRRCACRIIAQIIVHDNAMHINELNRCHFGLKIVSLIDIDDNEVFDYVCTIISSIIHKENATNPTFRLELLVQLVNAYARTLKTKIGDLINDIIRVMVDRSEFNGAWSEAILPLMYNLVTAPIQTDQVREKNLSFLSSLTEGFGFHERTDKIVQYRFVPMLIQLISGPVTIQLTTLKVIKNISKSYDEHIFDLLNANLLVPLKEILQKGSAKISRHLTLDILSNISGGHRTEVVAIINAGFVPLVLDVMLNSDRTSQLFATWIINNLTNRGGIDEIQSLIACGALDVLCKMLPIPDNDIIINALGALSQILISLRQHATFRDVVNTIEEFDGLSCIQLLQQHESADISLLAFEINESVFFHENYFNEAADIVWELQPAANEFQYKFEVEAWNTPSTTAINF